MNMDPKKKVKPSESIQARVYKSCVQVKSLNSIWHFLMMTYMTHKGVPLLWYVSPVQTKEYHSGEAEYAAQQHEGVGCWIGHLNIPDNENCYRQTALHDLSHRGYLC